MADRRVTQSRKDDEGGITALCDPGKAWSPRYKAAAIRDIENGIHTYYVDRAGYRTDVHVVDDPDGKYLRTRADPTSDNNPTTSRTADGLVGPIARREQGVAMSGVRVEGFDEFRNRLRKMAVAAEELERGKEVSLPELFPPSFMRRHTDFPTVQAMLEESGYEVQSTEDFLAIPEDGWDRYVADRTQFADWAEMLSTAYREYVTRELGLQGS